MQQNATVSFIRTIPSVLESHQISCLKRQVADYSFLITAGEELHLALKQTYFSFIIENMAMLVKTKDIGFLSNNCKMNF